MIGVECKNVNRTGTSHGDLRDLSSSRRRRRGQFSDRTTKNRPPASYDFSMADWTGRLKKIEQLCAAQNLDAFVVSSPINLKYLCGFGGSAGLLVCAPRG